MEADIFLAPLTTVVMLSIADNWLELCLHLQITDLDLNALSVSQNLFFGLADAT